MNLRGSFPRTAAEFPNDFQWNASFNWEEDSAVSAALAFSAFAIKVQDDAETFLGFYNNLHSDLTEQVSLPLTTQALAMIDGMRFIVAQPIIHQAMAAGKNGDCFNWVLWAVSRNHNIDLRTNVAD